MDNNKTYITIELTTGDVITPKEMNYKYNSIFEDKKIPIISYTIVMCTNKLCEKSVEKSIKSTLLFCISSHNIYLCETSHNIGNYNEREIQELNTAAKYATVMGLSQVDEENMERVRNFVMNLGTEYRAVFDSLWAHGDNNRLERIAEARLESYGGRN